MSVKETLRRLFQGKKEYSVDELGAYPTRMQVSGLPERRYFKTSRLLAIISIISLGLTFALSGVLIYYANRVDITIFGSRAPRVFAIDPEYKTLNAVEYTNASFPAVQFYVEDIVRDYIKKRHSVVWDMDIMKNEWGTGGTIALYSSLEVFQKFNQESQLALNASRSGGLVKDVILYDVRLMHGNLWTGLFDVFDMPIPDPFNPECVCADPVPECIACKVKKSLKRQRYRVYLRTMLAGTKSVHNPLGVLIPVYNLLYIPINPNENYWGLPPALRPDI